MEEVFFYNSWHYKRRLHLMFSECWTFPAGWVSQWAVWPHCLSDFFHSTATGSRLIEKWTSVCWQNYNWFQY